MERFFIGHWLTNLIIPGDPDQLTINTPAGSWELRKASGFNDGRAAIVNNGKTTETYSIELTGCYTSSRAVAVNAASEELIPICLAASYLTALSVTPTKSLFSSEVKFITVGHYFPRPRSMGPGFPVTNDTAEFADLVEAFVRAYTIQGAVEKIRLIAHHFLDGLAFWSLEDLVLSTTTILEVIAATANSLARPNIPTNNFNLRVDFAASRFNLPTLPSDFRNMRNDLIHQGTLSGTKFPNKDLTACIAAVTEALNWIDGYIFSAMQLGPIPSKRFAQKDFRGVNCFSL
ncbi:hypothetical protein ABEB22_10850 [Thioclava sp. 'Guangxiensis']|uniref:hypothetical protein n=1 Tax=Thioclava sp. 'Guangxiensis' TaxID=3149044 RepID=UPI0038780082